MMEASAQQGPAGVELALNDIQGNIAGFNKDHQRFVFLRFADGDSGRRFVSVSAREVDDCEDVLKFRRKWKRLKKDKGLREKATSRWFNLGLSSAASKSSRPPSSTPSRRSSRRA